MTVYKINDLVKFDFIKIPKTLFANPKYKEMSSDAKLTYRIIGLMLTVKCILCTHEERLPRIWV